MLSLYYAIFHSNLHYGLITWGSTCKSYLKKLSVLQNKAVKIVGGGKYYERATPFYSQLKTLKLEDLIRLETAIPVLVFKIKNKTLPAQFYNYINEVGYISKKSTRANTKKNYFIPFFEKTKSQRSIKYQDPLIWNSIDSEIKNIKSLKSFKIKLKSSFLKKYN